MSIFDDFNLGKLRTDGNKVAIKYYTWGIQLDEIDAFRHIYTNAILRAGRSGIA